MKTRATRFMTIIALVIIAATALSFVVMVLWNWLIPDLFSGPVITFWQAAGLLLLSKIIFSGLFHKKKHHMHQKLWRKEFARKVSEMDPEERELLKQKMKSKWGHWGCRIPEDIPEQKPAENS